MRKLTSQFLAERIVRTRKTLRRLWPDNLLKMMEYWPPMNLFETLLVAQREGKMLVSNYVHDKILTGLDDESLIRFYGGGKLTGTLVIYETPDKPFGKQVVFTREDNKINYYVFFTVPEQFQGKTNCALVMEHPDFELIYAGRNKYEIRSLRKADICIIENFPKKSHEWHDYYKRWYSYDKQFRIPTGEPKQKSNETRYLWRQNNAYIGLVMRRYDDSFGGCAIYLAVEPFVCLEAAFVSPL